MHPALLNVLSDGTKHHQGDDTLGDDPLGVGTLGGAGFGLGAVLLRGLRGVWATVNGRRLTKLQCFERAAALAPPDKPNRAWALLGQCVPSGAACTVAGTRYTRTQCLELASRTASDDADTWLALAIELPPCRADLFTSSAAAHAQVSHPLMDVGPRGLPASTDTIRTDAEGLALLLNRMHEDSQRPLEDFGMPPAGVDAEESAHLFLAAFDDADAAAKNEGTSTSGSLVASFGRPRSAMVPALDQGPQTLTVLERIAPTRCAATNFQSIEEAPPRTTPFALLSAAGTVQVNDRMCSRKQCLQAAACARPAWHRVWANLAALLYDERDLHPSLRREMEAEVLELFFYATVGGARFSKADCMAQALTTLM
jgi:hypothetical protein